MSVDEANAIILEVLGKLELVDRETQRRFADGGPDLELGSLGIDSMKVVDLCVGLEEHLGREVEIEELVENPTVRRLARHFADRAG
jgi:acyl carrier protein